MVSNKAAETERIPNGGARVFSTLNVVKSLKDNVDELPKVLQHFSGLSEDSKNADFAYLDGQHQESAHAFSPIYSNTEDENQN